VLLSHVEAGAEFEVSVLAGLRLRTGDSVGPDTFRVFDFYSQLLVGSSKFDLIRDFRQIAASRRPTIGT
jgi:hypothetical protein